MAETRIPIKIPIPLGPAAPFDTAIKSWRYVSSGASPRIEANTEAKVALPGAESRNIVELLIILGSVGSGASTTMIYYWWAATANGIVNQGFIQADKLSFIVTDGMTLSPQP